MPWSGYTGSERKLAQVAENYFNRIRENPSIKKGEQIDSKLSWKPSLHFQGFKHETIAVEASETPYPAILKTIHADIINVQIPIVVYCICPEDAFLLKSNQVDIKNLENHGYGLLTVNDAGDVTRRHACIPLIQHIPEDEVEYEIKQLTKKIKIRIRDAFETYRTDAGSGLSNLTEIVESVVMDAGRKISKKGWIGSDVVRRGHLHNLLDQMYNVPQCNNCKAAIGGVLSYVSTYRNTAHHAPKNRKQAHRKHKECKHGFLEGIKQIKNFRDAFKTSLQINVSIVDI